MKLKVFIFLLLLILLPQEISAQSINFDTSIANSKNLIEIKTLGNFEMQKYKIRTLYNNTLLLNKENKTFSKSVSWSKQPYLEDVTKIKVNFNEYFTNVGFEVLNTETAEVTQTKEIKIWGNKNISDYLSKLKISSTITKAPEIKHKIIANNSKEFNLTYEKRFYFIFLSIFLISLILGFVLDKNDKIFVWKSFINGSLP